MSDIESFVLRHLPHKVPSCKLTHLERGISNVNYKVTFADKESGEATQMVMTIFSNPNTWWKIDKEHFLREITRHDPDVLFSKIIDSGEDCLGEQRVAFLLREFVRGHDLDRLLEEGSSEGFDDDDWSAIARDLGFRLGALHVHALPFCGRITGADSQFAQRFSWRDFFTQQLETVLRIFRFYPDAKQIGSCRVEHIVSLFPSIEKLVERHVGSLETVEQSYLVHGDARFANFIVDRDANHVWKIAALIDLEWAMAGEPEVDLACIENWLHCSRYRAHFHRVKHDFMAGYNEKRAVSPHYRERRLLYHALRSLSFMGGVFGSNRPEFTQADPDIARSVERNYQILHALASGDYLESVDIPPINES